MMSNYVLYLCYSYCVGSIAAFEVDLELWPKEECHGFDVSCVHHAAHTVTCILP